MAAPPFLLLLLNILGAFSGACAAGSFTYNGFRSANLTVDGIARVQDNGLLLLTNGSNLNAGHAFFPDPVTFKSSPVASALSFSATFVFAIRSEARNFSTEGLAFVIAPTNRLPEGGASWTYLGLFDQATNASGRSRIFAVEMDTFKNPNSKDIDNNHVGVDISSISSVKQVPVGYYNDSGLLQSFMLFNAETIQAWVDYNGESKQITVSLAPLKHGSASKPRIPLINLKYDLSPVFLERMYVGFSSATGPTFVLNHYVLGCSFRVGDGMAENLDFSRLPKLPRLGTRKVSYLLTTGVPVISLFLISVAVFGVIYHLRRKKKFAEVLEDWEVAYGPHRFKFKDLYMATKGFKDSELLGRGGFGSVYKGVLHSNKVEIAVKRISHESRQGMREFVAEIVSIGRMSHRNLVPLLGYCRRKNELLLVYEYMPNGSLDRFLYGPKQACLNWDQRFRIIKGVASGLFYLHEEWEQVVVHRDVKASNVLLDGDLNARLGDFGLAKLYDRGTDPQTTHVVGTVGYLAPEHYRTGRATTCTDVYAFGAFLLEVVTGRRPIDPQAPKDDAILVESVFSLWNEGRILDLVDQNMSVGFEKYGEMEMVLKLGLLCSNLEPNARPTMQKVVMYLDGSLAFPDLSPSRVCISAVGFSYGKSFSDVNFSTSNHSYPSTGDAQSQFSQVTGSLLSGGR